MKTPSLLINAHSAARKEKVLEKQSSRFQRMLPILVHHLNQFEYAISARKKQNFVDFPVEGLSLRARILISPLLKPIWQPPLQISSYSPKPSCQVSLSLTFSKSPAITFTLVSALKVVSVLTVT